MSTGYDFLRDILQSVAFDADDDMTASETVTYTPKTGDARSIQVIPHRETTEPLGAGRKPVTWITVPNDADSGISDSELVLNADTITMAILPNGTPEARTIRKIRSKDAAFLRLELS